MGSQFHLNQDVQLQKTRLNNLSQRRSFITSVVPVTKSFKEEGLINGVKKEERLDFEVEVFLNFFLLADFFPLFPEKSEILSLFFEVQRWSKWKCTNNARRRPG